MSDKELSGTPITIKDGESFDMICCGCKMAHHFQIQVQNKKVVLRVFIDEYLTNRERRRKK